MTYPNNQNHYENKKEKQSVFMAFFPYELLQLVKDFQ